MENIEQFEIRIKNVYNADGKIFLSADKVFSEKLNEIDFLID